MQFYRSSYAKIATTLLVLLVSNCSNPASGPGRAISSGDGPLSVSSATIFPGQFRGPGYDSEFARISKLSFADYYAELAAHASDRAVTMDGVTIAGAKSDLEHSKFDLLALGNTYTSLADLWARIGINPRQMAEADFHLGIQRLGGSVPGSLALGAGLSTNKVIGSGAYWDTICEAKRQDVNTQFNLNLSSAYYRWRLNMASGSDDPVQTVLDEFAAKASSSRGLATLHDYIKNCMIRGTEDGSITQ